MSFINDLIFRVQQAIKREDGQTMAEYGVILALVVIIAAVGFAALGTGVDGLLDKVTGKLGS